MSEVPQKYTLRRLRYIEPGSDSPWKEVFGTQSDGTHRPQYYSQLELPKILEQIAKDARIWFPSEIFSVLNKHQLVLLRKLFDTLEVSDSSRLSVLKFLSSLSACSTEMYLVSLRYIFLSSEGKALARAALKLYTSLSASGDVSSSFSLEHFKGFRDLGNCGSEFCLALKRLLSSRCSAETVALLSLATVASSSSEVTCSKQLYAFNPHSSGASCLSQIILDYIGYGAGFYNYGLYGV